MKLWTYKIACAVIYVAICLSCYAGGYVQGWFDGYAEMEVNRQNIYAPPSE